jgi:hypothetical protein
VKFYDNGGFEAWRVKPVQSGARKTGVQILTRDTRRRNVCGPLTHAAGGMRRKFIDTATD